MDEQPRFAPLVHALPALLIAAMVLCVLWYYPHLPEKIPVHFDLRGNPNQWAGKATLWMMPILAILFEPLMAWTTKHPEKGNYPVPVTEANRELLYRLYVELMLFTRIVLPLMFLWFTVAMIRAALIPGLGLPVLPTSILVGVLLVGTFTWLIRMAKAK